MTPYHQDEHVTLYHGDCLDVLPTLPDASVDSVVTDPPYNLSAPKGRDECLSRTVAQIVLPDDHERDSEGFEGGHLARPSLGRSHLSGKAGSVRVSARIGVPEGAVDLDGPPIIEQEVDASDEPAALATDGDLTTVGDPQPIQLGGHYVLQRADGRDAPFCDGTCRCFTEPGAGLIAVSVVVPCPSCGDGARDGLAVDWRDAHVGLQHDTRRQAKRAACVLAGGRAVVRAVLRLDMRSGTGELSLTDGAPQGDALFLLRPAESVGARAGAGGLSAMPETHRICLVGDPADRAFTLHLPFHTYKSTGGFMGKEWDGWASPASFERWCRAWARECLRVLKPGGMIVAFGGTRTFHRLACAIEDAGFEIRDSIGYGTEERPGLLAWAYGSGFPKSLNVTKALGALPACSCGVASLGGEPAPVVEVSVPPSPVRARAGAEASAMGSAHSAADEAVGVGPQVVASRAPGGGVSDVDALDIDGIGQALPVVLRASSVAGATEGQEVVGLVGDVKVKPESLRDQMVGDEPVTAAAIGTPPVMPDDCGCDVHPSSPLIFPLAASPRGVVGAVEPVAVVDGHAGAGAVGAGVGPAAELIATEDTDVDSVSLTLHASHSTPERVVRCEACGGVRGKIPQGLGTALKPAWEPIVLARKPLEGAVAANVLAHGTGALNVDGCRVGAGLFVPGGGSNLPSGGIMGRKNSGKPSTAGHTSGRWPANVVLGHTPDCDVIYEGRGEIRLEGPCAPGCPVAELDRQSGEPSSRVGKPRGAAHGEGWGMTATGAEYADTGGASRFFYVAKAPTSERPRVGGIAHPTVKPLDLMRWLVRLVTPPGGTVLEPFAGSGTTAEACVLEGFQCIAIEREADYLPLITSRLDKPVQLGLDFGDPA